MKVCHHCHTEFPSGLTCPGCGAFVVDPPEDAEATDLTAHADAAPAPIRPVAPPGSLGGWVTAPAPPDSPSTPAPAPIEPSAEPAAPSRVPALPAPGSLGGWIRPPGGAAPPPGPGASTPASPPPAPPTPPASIPPPPAVPSPPAAEPNATEAPNTSATRVLAVVAGLVVLVLVGAFLLRPSGTGATDVPADIAGTCFRYNADRTILDRHVDCGQAHDGAVLAFVPEQGACPSNTNAILTTQADTSGTKGVLCVHEGP